MLRLRHSMALLLFFLPLVGCRVTHPRRAAELDLLLATPRRIAVLKPRCEVRVPYIHTPERLLSPEASEELAGELSTALRRSLEARGHQHFHFIELSDDPLLDAGPLEALRSALIEATRKSVLADLDYRAPILDPRARLEAHIPGAVSGRVELIIACAGRAVIETDQQFVDRWVRNVGLNLLTLPVNLLSSLIPIAAPLSINISTSLFERSPDELFLSLVVVRTSDGRIVYQNDLYEADVPSDSAELAELADALLEGFIREP